MIQSLVKNWGSTTKKYDFQVAQLKNKSKNLGSNLIQTNDLIVNNFKDTFLYGHSMFMLNQNSVKQVKVYMDNIKDKLLWISEKSKAFLLDLYFSSIRYTKINKNTSGLNGKVYALIIKQRGQDVTFLFSDSKQRKKYFFLFDLYIEQIRKNDPQYINYFSNVNKIITLRSTQYGNHNIQEKKILQISKKIGLNNERRNKQILQTCMNFHKTNPQRIQWNCIDDYFSIQFCNPLLQPVFQHFSRQKIGNTAKDARAILKKVMDSDEFKNFLVQFQKQTPQKAKQIAQKFKQNLSFFDFCRYLYDSNYNSISCPEQVDQTKPLKDYFCYSSHNTYLSGNQINSDCKAERYAEDLENGVKCVELDIHNDGGKPIVTHAINGKGLCKPVDFQDVIKVVDEFSQKCTYSGTQHYPIILSLQNHASIQNKQMMLDIMTKHFNKNLYFLNPNQRQFPSLSYLKGKIIIKSSSHQQQIRQFKKQNVKKVTSLPVQILQRKISFKQPGRTFINTRLQDKYNQFNRVKREIQIKKSKFNARISKIEQIFIPISSMAKFTTIFKSESGITHNQSQFACTSLETGAVSKKPKADLIRYTSNSWLRTYPHGTEVKSANYDPAEMLAVGAQIIALNTQTKDDYAWMMYRYFCAGSAVNLIQRGYVLKPQRLRHPEKFLNQTNSKIYTLRIQLIQTQGYEIIMRFRGLASDNLLNSNQPLQGGKNQSIATFTYTNPDQSFIIFDIGDKYRDCVAIRWIKQGYRNIQGRFKDDYIDTGKRAIVNVKISQNS